MFNLGLTLNFKQLLSFEVMRFNFRVRFGGYICLGCVSIFWEQHDLWWICTWFTFCNSNNNHNNVHTAKKLMCICFHRSLFYVTNYNTIFHEIEIPNSKPTRQQTTDPAKMVPMQSKKMMLENWKSPGVLSKSIKNLNIDLCINYHLTYTVI